MTVVLKGSEAWIGQVEVKAEPGNDALGNAAGAFVNVVALATSESDYVKLVDAMMNEYGFTIINYTDVARVEEWRKSNRLHPKLAKLAGSLSSENPIQFDDFQSYRHPDDA